MKTRQLTKDCNPIVEECKGCNRVFNSDGVEYCLAYANPALFWKNVKEEEVSEGVVFGKSCGLASHIEIKVTKERKRIGQQKQRRDR